MKSWLVIGAMCLSCVLIMSNSFGQVRKKLKFAKGDTLEQLRYKIKFNGYKFKVKRNWVYDMSPEKKAKFFRRHAPVVMKKTVPTPGNDPLQKHVGTKKLDSSFDWRSYNGHSYVTSIQNQGNCGMCYAFAACAVAEGAYNLAMKKYDSNCANFSESYIGWCLGSLDVYKDHFGGCGGADYDYYELTALTSSGLSTEYDGCINDSDCPYSETQIDASQYLGKYTTVKFKSWDRVYPTSYDDTTTYIKTAISTYGTVDAAVLAEDAFSAYSSGVYEDTNTTATTTPYYNSTTNHAIALVGWDDNPTEGGGGCWILRNSWGTNWGESGYMRIRYKSARVNCAACYMIYEGDGGGGGGDTTAKISLSKSTLSPTCGQGEDATSDTFVISNSGTGTLGYTVTTDVNWMSFNPSSGTVTKTSSTQTGNSAVLNSGAQKGTTTLPKSDPDFVRAMCNRKASGYKHKYPIMQPDEKTKKRWLKDYENAPKALILKTIPNKRGSASLLGNLQYTPSERNQQSCGNCWVWAGTGVMGINMYVNNSVKDRLSIQWANANCPNIKSDGKYACAGGWLSDLATIYNSLGKAIPWSNTNAEFQDGDGQYHTTPDQITSTPSYGVSNMTTETITTTGVDQATAIANIKNVLDQNKAVWFAFYGPNATCWNDFYSFWDNSSEDTAYDYSSYSGQAWDNDGGGHAMLLCGYDDSDASNSYWLILNSWGTGGTGNRTNGTMRMDMNIDYSMTDSAGGQLLYFQTADMTWSTGGGGGDDDDDDTSTGETVTVSYNTDGLTAGTYTGTITVANTGVSSDTATIAVTLTVTGGAGTVNVTVGSQFDVAASSCTDAGITSFEKKPKIYALDGTKKKSVKTVKGTVYPCSTVTCEWKQKIAADQYDLYVEPKARGVKYTPECVTENLYVKAPEITSGTYSIIDYKVTRKGTFYYVTISLDGLYFGGKKPKVYFIDDTTYKKYNFRVGKTDCTMDVDTGTSELFGFCKKIPADATGYVYVEQKKIGYGTIGVTWTDSSSSPKKGTLTLIKAEDK